MFGRVLIIVLTLAVLGAMLARTSSGSGKEQVYLVRPYDTLWTIAERRYGGDPREGVWRIQQRNHLDGTTLQPGDRLMLPP
jgi:hypothetical protein